MENTIYRCIGDKKDEHQNHAIFLVNNLVRFSFDYIKILVYLIGWQGREQTVGG